ncbi:MAG: caspase family protein [Saprospiraceae bacterium]
MKSSVIQSVLFLYSICLFSQQKGASPLPLIEQKLSNTNTYAVVIGISDYQDPNIPDLRFADKDAEAFANYLRSNASGKLDNDHLKVLINSQATMAQFANALDWLWENVKEGDQAIIYFSGHGDVEKKSLTQPGFLLCWDAPARVYMAGGAFALPMLQEVISTLSIQNKAKVIVITDACRSGTLAGSSVGGSQATAANLAKQFGNEIKIMSCQPNEYSIEGEQWGGGRGAFSYHLLDALYGMADGNNDQWVTLQEIGRYLEDHVTNEVAPISQVPMIIGNRNERLTAVDEQMVASIKSGKTNQMILSAIESRGIEEDVLSKLDTNTKVTYQLFKLALKNKTFLEPIDACANNYYEQLINEPKLERLHSTMKRNYAAALQDEAQQVINGILKSDINENIFTNMRKKADQYNLYPRKLDRAAELLGPQHYMYKSLKARKYFFEGITLATFNTKTGTIGNISDKKVIPKVMNYYHQALNWQNDLSYVYLNIGLLYGLGLKQLDSAEYYMYLAIKTTPSWIYPYIMLNEIYKNNKSEKTRIPLDQANGIDSNSAIVLYKWGEFYTSKQKYDSSEMKLLQLLDHKELGFCRPCVHNALGLNYSRSGRSTDAEKQYLIAYKLDSTLDPIFQNLSSLYLNLKRFPEAEFFATKSINRFPDVSSAYGLLAYIFQNTNRIPLADSLYRIAIKLDSFDKRAYVLLSEIYLNTQRIQEAESILLMGIRNNPLAVELVLLLGKVYFQTQRIEEANQQFNKVLKIDSNNVETHFQLGLVYNQLKRYEESEIENRKVIQLNPKFSLAYYNLACAFSMQNKANEGFIQLELAIQKGFNQYENIQQDTDLDNLKLMKEKWTALLKKYFPDKVK